METSATTLWYSCNLCIVIAGQRSLFKPLPITKPDTDINDLTLNYKTNQNLADNKLAL